MNPDLKAWLPWIAVAAVALIVIVVIAINGDAGLSSKIDQCRQLGMLYDPDLHGCVKGIPLP